MIQDKTSVIQVLGGLLHHPEILSETEKYQLDTSDFPERFHAIIFAAINNLYNNGAEEITEAELDGFLSAHSIQYEIFNQNKGIDYIQNIMKLHRKENFDYYYERLKKFSLVREMKGVGFDISEIYDDTILDPKESEKLQKNFDDMTIKDIIAFYESKIVEIKDKFESDSEAKGIHASEGIDELLDRLERSPDIGLPLNSPILTSVTRGARKQKFYIRSSYSGGGKTRNLIADSLRLSAKGWYDSELEEWVENDFNEKSVVISTEMTFDELQTPAIAYIADVEEHKILMNETTEEEKERVRYAANILKQSNVYFEHLPNFNVDDIERTIVKNIIKHEVEYVMFDYIHSSVEILGSFAKSSGISLREDQVLLLMADKLKQICNKHGVFLLSATQLNGEWKEAQRKGIEIDEAFIRGSKAIIDKTDFSAIMLPVSARERKELEDVIQDGFGKLQPNLVTHVFKNRGNQHTKIKIFSHINLGTMRIKDLFACDADNFVVPVDELVIHKKEEKQDIEF